MVRGRAVAQTARQPIDVLGASLEAASIARGSIPTAQPMSRGRKVLNQISTQEPRCPGHRDQHGTLPLQLDFKQCNPVYRIPVRVKRKLRLEKAGGMGRLSSPNVRLLFFQSSAYRRQVAVRKSRTSLKRQRRTFAGASGLCTSRTL